MRVPSSILRDAEIQVLANDISAKTGLPVTTCRLTDADPFIPPTIKADPRVSCLRAFRSELTGEHKFAVVGFQNPGFYDVVIFTEEGFQVWPTDPRDAAKAPTKEDAERWMTEQLIIPALKRIHGIGMARFEEWLNACRKKLGEASR